MTAQKPDVPRYGARRVPKMWGDVNRLRQLIRQEGTPAIQDAWDEIEPHVDFAYAQVGMADTKAGLK